MKRIRHKRNKSQTGFRISCWLDTPKSGDATQVFNAATRVNFDKTVSPAMKVLLSRRAFHMIGTNALCHHEFAYNPPFVSR
jgi:hypothetical protein